MLLRRESPDDEAAIRAVHTSAFGGGVHVAEARLVDELRAAGDVIPGLSIVAVDDDEVVGHVVCSRASIDGRASVGLGVVAERQRRGVGHALMHAVLSAADALGEPAVLLLGAPTYYSRFGFVPAAPLGILPPVSEWEPHFQVRRLTTWEGDLIGTFRYAPAFSELS